MRLEPSDSQLLVREVVERIVGHVTAQDVRDHWNRGVMEDVYRALGTAGFLELFALDVDALALPESAVEPCIVMEVLGAHSALVPVVASVVLASPFGALAQMSTDALTQGTGLWSACVWGPGAGGADGGCTVSRVEAGSIITGEIPFVEYANTAEHVVVPAVVDGQPAVAVVPMDADGVVVATQAANGGTPLCLVRFRDVLLADAQVVSGPRCGQVGDAVKAFGLLTQSAYLLGGAQRALDMAVEHVTERRQFHRQIGSFQSVRHRLADMAIALQGARLLLYERASRFDPGHTAVPECAEVKAWTSSASADVLRLAHELHGGIGAVDDHELTLLFRRNLAERSLYGAAPALWELAGELLHQPITMC